MQNALAQSSNTAFTDLDAPGRHRQHVIQMAQAYGVDTVDASGLTGTTARPGRGVALGVSSLTVNEQTQMLATIDDNGVYHAGAHHQVLAAARAARSRRRTSRRTGCSPRRRTRRCSTRWRRPPSTGPVHRAPMGLGGRPIIGKTGTTSNYRPASSSARSRSTRWSSGCSPISRTPPRLPAHSLSELGGGGFGGYWPAKIWNTFAQAEFANLRPENFQNPEFTGAAWNQIGKIPKAKPKKPTTAKCTAQDPRHDVPGYRQGLPDRRRRRRRRRRHAADAAFPTVPDGSDADCRRRRQRDLTPVADRHGARRPPTATHVPHRLPVRRRLRRDDAERRQGRPGRRRGARRGAAGLAAVDDRVAAARVSGPGAARTAVACGRHPERGAGHVRYRYPAYVGAGVGASVLAALLGYSQKLPCSSGGAWNSFTGQFRDACYTDIYPLYYNEGLAAGKVPYYGHPVEYPVLIGAMMQAAAWLVHSVSDPYTRGRDFYYVTVVMLAVCLLAGVLATAATADREGGGGGLEGGAAGRAVAGAHPGRVRQLGPVRDGARRRRPRRLGGAAAVPGRGAARPGGGDEVLPAAVLRRAVAALPAGREDARVRQGVRRGPGRLAGGQPAGRDRARRPAGPASTRSAGTEAPTGGRSGTCSSTTTSRCSATPRRAR